MRLTMIGAGYVGLVTGTCFAEMGNDVVCIDNDQKKIDNLRQGIIPIYEPGLDVIIKQNVEKQSLSFSTDLDAALKRCEIVFIAVGTPQGEDGSADLQYVLAVAKSIGRKMVRPLIIVDKSTVPVGTADKVREAIAAELKNRGQSITFHVVSNPEFLKEGAAVDDFMKPDRVIVGADDEWALSMMKELYAPFTLNHDRFIRMDVRSAEMTKYAANAMLATKISFMNEIATICEKVGADVNLVRKGIGSDRRIGYGFIYPGCGYGGSCFPKDVKALEKIALDAGVTPSIVKAVESVNQRQKRVLAEKIFARFGNDLSGKTFGIWGLSFKPETDDMREAPSIVLIKTLLEAGAAIKAYDPKAVEEAKHVYLKGVPVVYCDSKYDAVKDADAMVLVTEWKEFRSPDFEEILKRMATPIIFDGRNQYNAGRLAETGFEYHQIGVGRVIAPKDKESQAAA